MAGFIFGGGGYRWGKEFGAPGGAFDGNRAAGSLRLNHGGTRTVPLLSRPAAILDTTIAATRSKRDEAPDLSRAVQQRDGGCRRCWRSGRSLPPFERRSIARRRPTYPIGTRPFGVSPSRQMPTSTPESIAWSCTWSRPFPSLTRTTAPRWRAAATSARVKRRCHGWMVVGGPWMPSGRMSGPRSPTGRRPQHAYCARRVVRSHAQFGLVDQGADFLASSSFAH